MAENEAKPVAKQIKYYVELNDEEKLKRYKNHFNWSREAQKGWRGFAENLWTYYRLKNNVFTQGGQKVRVPTILKNVDAMYAALTAFDVVPIVAPKGMTTYKMAEVQTEALRNEWDELEVVQQDDYCKKDSLIAGIGYVYIGYDYEDSGEEVEETGVVLDEESGEMREDTVVDDSEVTVIKDQVLVEYVPWDEVYFDPEAKVWEDVNWIARVYELPLEEVKNDPTFVNTADLKSSSVINEKWRGEVARKAPPNDINEERVLICRYDDLVRGTVCYFSPGHEEILKETVNPLAGRMTLRKRNPYCPYVTRRDNGTPIGISDAAAMKTMNDEQNVIRSSVATFVERARAKLLADHGALGDKAKEQLQSREWFEVVELREGSVNANSVAPLKLPDLPSESFYQDERANLDADQAIGMSELLGGQLPVGRKTATAMQQLGQAVTVRQSEKRNALERHYREIADKMLYLMKMFYTQERITRLVGETGDEVWSFTGDDLQFDSQVQMELEPKEVLDADAKREKFLALANIFGADPTVNQPVLKRYIMVEGLGIPEEIAREILKSEEDIQNEAEMAHQREVELSQAKSLNIQPNQAMQPGALGGPPQDLGEAAESGSVGTAAPVL